MRTTKIELRSLAIAMVFSVLCPHVAMAAAAEPWSLDAGRFRMTPSLGYALTYSDNVFYEDRNTQDDFYHTISPGFRVDYEGPRPGTYANIGYNGDIAHYQDLDDNDWQRHRGFLTLGYEAPMGLYLRVEDYYAWSEDPFGTFNEYNQSNEFGLGEKTRRWDNNARLTLGYRLGSRWFTEGSYRNYRIRYDQAADHWQDRLEDEYDVGLFYRLTPRTAVFASYATIFSDYDRQNDGVTDPGNEAVPGDEATWSSATSQDNRRRRYSLGLRVEPGGKLDGEVRAGYGDMTFDNDRDARGRPYDDWSGLILSGTVYYRPTERTFLSLNVQQSPLGSPDAESAMYVNTLVGIALRQELARRFTAGVEGRWNYDDYKNEVAGAEDKYFYRYWLGLSLDWAIQPWLSAGVEYAYEEKTASDSDYAASEYRVNSVAMVIRYNY